MVLERTWKTTLAAYTSPSIGTMTCIKRTTRSWLACRSSVRLGGGGSFTTSVGGGIVAAEVAGRMRLSGSSIAAADDVESLATGSSCTADGEDSESTVGMMVETTGTGLGTCDGAEPRAAARSILAFALSKRLNDFSV